MCCVYVSIAPHYYDFDFKLTSDAKIQPVFRKEYPEYANNWLVSQIAVRAETVNVTAHCAGCNTLIIILLGL